MFFEISVLYMFCSNKHYMYISHMAIFMYMATQQIPPKGGFYVRIKKLMPVSVCMRLCVISMTDIQLET